MIFFTVIVATLVISLGISVVYGKIDAVKDNITEITIAGDIDNELVLSVIPLIRDAKKTLIFLHIESTGGWLGSYITIARALNRHKGGVVVVIDTYAYSAAAMIALSADKIVLKQGAELMYHLPTLWEKDRKTVIGQMLPSNVKVPKHIKILNRFLKKLKAAKCFMSDYQWNMLMKGENIYIRAESRIVLIPNCKQGDS